MEWGTPVQWGTFLLFCVPQSVKTKETNPTRPGSPTPCKCIHVSVSKFAASTNCEIWHSHVVVVQGRPRNVQKSVMHVQTCCFANLNILLFGSSRGSRLRRCLSSVLTTSRTAKSTQLQKPLCTSFIEHFTFLFIRSAFRGRF